MPIELIIGAISGGVTICAAIWKLHHSMTKKTIDHESRLKDIEHTNEIQSLHISNMKEGHENLGVRILRVENNIESMKISIAEILQILKQKD